MKSPPTRLLHRGLLAFPLIALLVFVLAFAVDVPFADGWALLPELEKIDDGSWTLADLHAQFCEHRLFFSKLVMLVVARATDWNTLYQCLVSLLCAGAVVLGFRAMLRNAGSELPGGPAQWPLIAGAWLVCSLHQWRNWLWGWQITMLMSFAALVWTLAVLGSSRMTPRKLALASGFGLVSSFSFASGLIVWPFGLLLLLAREGRRRWSVVSWGLVALGAFVVFFWGYRRDHGIEAAYWMVPVGRVVGACLEFAGSPVLGVGRPGAEVAGAFCLLGVVALLPWWIRERRRLRSALPFVLLGLFAFANGLALVAGRFRYGGSEGLGIRHVTCTVPLWLSLVALTHVAARVRDARVGGRSWQTAWGSGIALLLVVLTVSQVGSLRSGIEFSRKLARGRAALVRGDGMTDGLGLEQFTNHVAMGIYRRAILDRGWSVFRDPAVRKKALAESDPPIVLAAKRLAPDRLHITVTRGQPGRPLTLYVRTPPLDSPVLLQAVTFGREGSFEFTVPLPVPSGQSSLELLAGTLNRAGTFVFSNPIAVDL